MPMTRDRESEQPLHPALLHPNELIRLQAVFRRALRVAFASSLVAAAGCNVTHDDAPGGQNSEGGSGEVAGSDAPKPVAGRSGAAGDRASAAGRRAPQPGAGTGAMPPPLRDGGTPPSRDGGSSSEPIDDAGSAPHDAGVGPGEAPVCDSGWRMLAELNPAEPFDFAAYRSRYMYNGSVQETAREGTPCSGATAQAECVTALEQGASELTSWQPCGQVGQCIHYVVTTRGDEIRHYASADEVRAFLGPIDRPQDALLLLYYLRYEISCETTRVWAVADGFEATVQKMVAECPVQNAKVRAHVSRDGTITELTSELLPPTNLCIGRRPEGMLAEPAAASGGELGAHFASIAQLEAASVAAFDVLARELEAHAAPASLVAAAREAARDEVRHAARMSQLARRFGVTARAPRVEARPLRGLEALALDNAVEGCVRETFGAAIGCYQAQAARDPEIAAVMTEIAADETRHAALAQAIHRWAFTRLSQDARAMIERAQAKAVRELAGELRAEPSHDVRDLAGVPDAATAAKLYDAVHRELWQ